MRLERANEDLNQIRDGSVHCIVLDHLRQDQCLANFLVDLDTR